MGCACVRDGLKSSDQIVIDGLANPMVRPGAKVVPQKGDHRRRRRRSVELLSARS